MPPETRKSPEAEDDLLNHFVHIGRYSQNAAWRFLRAADRAFELLARFPELGTPCGFRRAGHREFRYWSIRKFRKHIIIYRPLPQGIEVVRVLYGARNIPRLFGE